MSKIGDCPAIKSSFNLDDKIYFCLAVTDQLPCLQGHFPQMAIVPGISQLHWAVEFAKKFFQISALTEANQIKFSHIMRPGDEVNLCLENNPEKKQITYRYGCSNKIDHLYSSGRFTYVL